MSLQISALLGVIVTLLIAIYAFKKQQLTEKGTIAAMLVGITLFALGGWSWFALLVVFFLSSSLLSKYKKTQKFEFTKEHEKRDHRDAWQVFANSLPAAVVAAVYFIYPSPAVFAAFVAAVATVNSDTWATEIGLLDKKTYWILSGKPAKQGQSGAVSITGLVAAAVASVFITVSAVALSVLNNLLFQSYSSEEVFATQFIGGIPFILLVAFAGFFGCVADSVLGATVQARYYCPKCKKITEKVFHGCGTRTTIKQGFALLDNDSVNFLASIAGSVFAYCLALVFL